MNTKEILFGLIDVITDKSITINELKKDRVILISKYSLEINKLKKESTERSNRIEFLKKKNEDQTKEMIGIKDRYDQNRKIYFKLKSDHDRYSTIVSHVRFYVGNNHGDKTKVDAIRECLK